MTQQLCVFLCVRVLCVCVFACAHVHVTPFLSLQVGSFTPGSFGDFIVIDYASTLFWLTPSVYLFLALLFCVAVELMCVLMVLLLLLLLLMVLLLLASRR